MTQTVSLVRLPSLYPPDQGDTLASAFGSLTSCAIVSRVRAPEIPMSEAESHLARLLAPMLHGVQVGAPLASIESPAQSPLCPNQKPFGDALETPDTGSIDRARSDLFSHRLAVSMTVPLADGRIVTTRNAIETPEGWNRATLLSFLLSSLTVAIVAVLSVRT